jgi:hypothetical protein
MIAPAGSLPFVPMNSRQNPMTKSTTVTPSNHHGVSVQVIPQLSGMAFKLSSTPAFT